MKQIVENFLEGIKAQEHILPLIEHADVHVNLQSPKETIQLAFKNGEILPLVEEGFLKTNYEICGDDIGIELLLSGNKKLRILEKTGQLKVTAPLRTILMLESIFFLTKTTAETNKSGKIH